MSTPYPWRIPCACGHLEVDHARGGTGLINNGRGICLRPDCTCRKFARQPDAPKEDPR